jgi:molybdenum cofactor cytidylyltransferase/nicotine blue oxidoreductase
MHRASHPVGRWILDAVPTIAAAVLAAGSGTRMGRVKAELVVDGARLLDRAVAVLRDAGCDPVIAVVREGTSVAGVSAVVNPDPGRGMRSSLELAVDAAGDADALAVLLVDTPGIESDAVRAVIAAWRPGRIAVARYGVRRGHPTVMGLPDWRAAVQLAGPDEGARALLAAHADRVDEIEVSGDATDLDTPDDITRWETR